MAKVHKGSKDTLDAVVTPKDNKHEFHYVDDCEIYKMQLTSYDRKKYYEYANERARKNLVRKKSADVVGVDTGKAADLALQRSHSISSRKETIFNSVITRTWDYCYISLFLAFLFTVSVVSDGKDIHQAVYQNISRPLLPTAILILMFISQMPPLLGIIYFMCNYNQHTHFKAETDFGKWAFVSVLTAQYIEHFYYGGIDVMPPEPAVQSASTLTSLALAKIVSVAAATATALKTARSQITGRTARSEMPPVQGADQIKGSTSRRVSIIDTFLLPSNRSVLAKEDQYGKTAQSAVSTVSAEFGYCEDRSEDDEEGEDEEELDAPAVSYMDAMRRQRAEEEEAAEKLEQEEKVERERKITDWLLWSCVVCNSSNRLPRHPLSHAHTQSQAPTQTQQGSQPRHHGHSVDGSTAVIGAKGEVFFESLGKGDLTRTVAVVKSKRDMPVCQKCFTYADYTPPLSSAHLFPHYEHRYQAFFNYPTPVLALGRVQDPQIAVPAAVSEGGVRSFLLSLPGRLKMSKRKKSDRLVYNDWRLPLYLVSTFQDVPRPSKKSAEYYVRGEIVECSLQRTEWMRARIILARPNHTYDIRYDAGDELRLVEESQIRMPPTKGDYASRVELGIVIMVVTFPLFLLAAISPSASSSTEHPRKVVFLGIFLVAMGLLFMRVKLLVTYMHRHRSAGLMTVLRLSLVYMAPIIALLLASSPVSISKGWTGAAVLWGLTKCICLPFLHAIKPSFALFGGILFLQTSLGLMLLALRLDRSSAPLPPYTLSLSLSVCLSPLASSCVTLMVYRAVWDKVWDVSLTIRNDPTRHSLSLPSSVSWMHILSSKMKMNVMEYISTHYLLLRCGAAVRVTPEEFTDKKGVEDITEMDTNMPV